MTLPFFGEHGDLDIQSKSSFLVTVDSKNALFLADSKNLDPHLYRRMQQYLPSLDALFIGLESEGAPVSWLYGPLMQRALSAKQNRSRRLNGSNAEEGFSIIETLKCKRVYIYAMGYEPWLTFISNLDLETSTAQISEANMLVQLCQEKGLSATLLYGSAVVDY